MQKSAFIAAIMLLSTPAHAYWTCDGVLTSNNVCIGSQSNVESRDNHEPVRTRPRDYFRPRIREEKPK